MLALAAAVWWLVPPPPPKPAEHAYPIPSFENRITVEVLNGTKRAGVARAATRMLRHRGIDVVFFGNAEAAADSTRIVVRREIRGAAAKCSARWGWGSWRWRWIRSGGWM